MMMTDAWLAEVRGYILQSYPRMPLDLDLIEYIAKECPDAREAAERYITRMFE